MLADFAGEDIDRRVNKVGKDVVGLLEVDRKPGRLGMLGEERLDGEAALGERAAAGVEFHEDPGNRPELWTVG